MNRPHLRYRLVNPRGHFVDMMDLRRTTSDPCRALMGTQEQVNNCLRRYPELKGFRIEEVIPSKQQVIR